MLARVFITKTLCCYRVSRVASVPATLCSRHSISRNENSVFVPGCAHVESVWRRAWQDRVGAHCVTVLPHPGFLYLHVLYFRPDSDRQNAEMQREEKLVTERKGQCTEGEGGPPTRRGPVWAHRRPLFTAVSLIPGWPQAPRRVNRPVLIS